MVLHGSPRKPDLHCNQRDSLCLATGRAALRTGLDTWTTAEHVWVLQSTQVHSFAFQGPIDSQTVIPCVDLFHRPQPKSVLVVVDNASTHTREDFENEFERWQKEEFYMKFFPPCCPERHLIEIFWCKFKYERLS